MPETQQTVLTAIVRWIAIVFSAGLVYFYICVIIVVYLHLYKVSLSYQGILGSFLDKSIFDCVCSLTFVAFQIFKIWLAVDPFSYIEQNHKQLTTITFLAILAFIVIKYLVLFLMHGTTCSGLVEAVASLT